MRRATLCILPVAISLLVAVGAQAKSSDWAGSRYSKQDCHRVSGGTRPGLYCEKWVTTRAQSTQTLGVTDDQCPTGIRLYSRSGTIEERFKVYDSYDGPVSIARFAIGGNESSYTETWIDFNDTDLGCA